MLEREREIHTFFKKIFKYKSSYFSLLSSILLKIHVIKLYTKQHHYKVLLSITNNTCCFYDACVQQQTKCQFHDTHKQKQTRAVTTDYLPFTSGTSKSFKIDKESFKHD